MTNVTWSSATGARSYITTLMSSHGHAKCHTLDTHCLMGCITCGTNYSVSLEAISSTGHTSECSYRGFSSSEKKYSKRHSTSLLKMQNNSVCWNVFLQVPAVQQTSSSIVWPTTSWGRSGAPSALRYTTTRLICTVPEQTTPARQRLVSSSAISRRKYVVKSTELWPHQWGRTGSKWASVNPGLTRVSHGQELASAEHVVEHLWCIINVLYLLLGYILSSLPRE